MKRLDEIAERDAARTQGEWHAAHRHGGADCGPYVYVHGGTVLAWFDDPADAAFVAHAPADLALLLRLVSNAAGAPCLGIAARIDGFGEIPCGWRGGGPVALCISCGMRRELELAP